MCLLRVPSGRRTSHTVAAGLLLWNRRAGDIDRLLHGGQAGGQQQPRRSSGVRRPNADSATLSAEHTLVIIVVVKRAKYK